MLKLVEQWLNLRIVGGFTDGPLVAFSLLLGERVDVRLDLLVSLHELHVAMACLAQV
jgi:hypothetical protein